MPYTVIGTYFLNKIMSRFAAFTIFAIAGGTRVQLLDRNNSSIRLLKTEKKMPLRLLQCI